jgi:hypothetical protein
MGQWSVNTIIGPTVLARPSPLPVLHNSGRPGETRFVRGFAGGRRADMEGSRGERGAVNQKGASGGMSAAALFLATKWEWSVYDSKNVAPTRNPRPEDGSSRVNPRANLNERILSSLVRGPPSVPHLRWE